MQASLTQQKTGFADIKAYFDKYGAGILSVVPPHAKNYLTPDRVLGLILMATQKTPDLLKASPQAIIAAFRESARLGLEPGPLDHVYLVPRGKDIQFTIGYKGLMELARRSGEVAAINARAVYANDEFDITYEPVEAITHKPCWKGDKGQCIGVYCTVTMVNGYKAIEFMTMDEVERIKKTSPAANNGPWKNHYEAMAIKTVVRRLLNRGRVARSTELADAIAQDGSTVDNAGMLQPPKYEDDAIDTTAVGALEAVLDEAQHAEETMDDRGTSG